VVNESLHLGGRFV